jgi:glycosyltransferase involved in cell wall biosynthesis
MCLADDDRWPRALFVAPSWTDTEVIRAAEQGARPRIDYVDLARAFRTAYLHFNDLAPGAAPGVSTAGETLSLLLQERALARLARRRAAEMGVDEVVALAEGVGCWMPRRGDPWPVTVIMAHPLSPRRAVLYHTTRFLARVHRLLFFSTAEREAFVARYRINPERARVLLGSIDTDFYRPSEEPAAERPFVFAFGVSKRDYATLVAAMRRLPHIRCVIAPATIFHPHGVDFGPGPPPPNVEVLTEFSVDTTHRLLQTCAFTVIPIRPGATQWTAGITAAMLSQAVAKPLVGTRLPGTPEYVAPELHHLLVPGGDAAVLADTIEALWARPESHQTLGAAGRRYVEQHLAVGTYPVRMRQALRG